MKIASVGIGIILIISTFWFSPLVVLGTMLGILLLGIITYRPELGLLVIVFITVGLIDADQIPFLKMGPISLHVSDIILLYLLGIIVIKRFFSPNFKLVRTYFDFPMICFLFAIFLSVFIAIEIYGVERQWVFRRMRPMAYYLAFFSVTNLIREKKQLNVLIIGLFIIAVIGSLLAITLVVFPSIPLVKSGSSELITAGKEFSGVIRSELPVYKLICVMFMVSVCSLIMGSRWVPPALEFARAGIMGIAIFLSFTRNLWVGMISMLTLLGLLVSWPERFRILKWVTIGGISAVLLFSFTGRYGEKYLAAGQDRLFRGMEAKTLAKDSSVEWRIAETKYAIKSIIQHPIVGIGLGNFYRPAIFENESVAVPDKPNYGLRWYIHNAYLWVWVDMGLIGIIPFICLHTIFLMRGVKHWRKVEDQKLRALALGITLGYLSMVISNFVAPSFVQDWGLVVFSVVMGMNEVVYLLDKKELTLKHGGQRNVQS